MCVHTRPIKACCAPIHFPTKIFVSEDMKNPLELFFETWHVIASVGQSDDSIKIVGPKVSLQTLEDRVLYDASPLAAFAAEVNDQINTESMEGADLELVENDDFEALEVPVATEFDENDLVLGAVEGDIKFQSARQLVVIDERVEGIEELINCLLYTSPSPRDS